MDLTTKTRKAYQDHYAQYGIGPKALQWSSMRSIEMRYSALIDESVDFENKSILEIGPGFGYGIPYIKARAKKIDYTGIDLVPEFVGVARMQYPKHKFIVGDYFAKPLKKKFDIILTSGTLNANVSSPLTYRCEIIKSMWEKANYAVLFNMAGYNPQPKNKKSNKVYYANAHEVLDFCLKLTPKIIFKQNYSKLKNDFTIIMFKAQLVT